MLLLIEFGLAAISIAVAYAVPNLGSRWFEKVENLFSSLARRRLLAILVVGISAMAARAAVMPLLPVPVPGINDEFGYLLAADTFAHGRIVNPTHPMWMHFESFHINQIPACVPMFYPAQGLILALGQFIGGHPFVGVLLSVGLMCAALCWMLQGWLPPGWALVGGFLSVIRLGTFSYWANSYWGGAVAAAAGALVLGALPRIKRRPRVRDSLLMGLGFAVLANSRPYEGLFLGLPVGVALLTWMLGKARPRLRLTIRRVLLPLLLLLAVTLAAMGYYFWRATGSPFRPPYQENLETYAVAPYFPWQSLKPAPVYNHPVMERFYLGWPLDRYHEVRSHPVEALLQKTIRFGLFFGGPALALPVLALAAIKLGRPLHIGRKMRFLLLVFCVSLIGMALPIYFLPHYAAPLTAVIYALVVQALRHVRLWRWQGWQSGQFLVRAVPSICVVMLLLRMASPWFHIPSSPAWLYSWCSPQFQMRDRAQVLTQLEGYGGRHLAIVRYKPDHDVTWEWVYNGADIDGANVVWARDMGPAQNQELIDYFKDRRVWLIEPDETPVRSSPFPIPPDRRALAHTPGGP